MRALFAVKCAICHGPDLARPKARFGYVLDLKRIAENPEMVIPGEPDQSELWELVRHGEMPQPESPGGPLSDDQKELVRTWIVAGAPAPMAIGSLPAPVKPERDNGDIPPSALLGRALRWLGKFHLLLIHFPIALVLAATAGELWAAIRRRAVPSEAVGFCVNLAALAVVPTAFLGWIFAATGEGADAPQLLLAHRLLGTTTALILIATAASFRRDLKHGARTRTSRWLLCFAALVVMLTAHLGGLTAHGADFFVF